mgnify:CR=1 FL=1
MSNRSNNQGRAYEFAWVNALYIILKQHRTVKIVENSSLEANQRAWDLKSKKFLIYLCRLLSKQLSNWNLD